MISESIEGDGVNFLLLKGGVEMPSSLSSNSSSQFKESLVEDEVEGLQFEMVEAEVEGLDSCEKKITGLMLRFYIKSFKILYNELTFL